MLDEQFRREHARAAIRAGKLPSRSPERSWGGPGIGENCPVCDTKIDSDELEFEIEFSGDGASPGSTIFHLHVGCFTAWQFERTRRAWDGR